MDISLLIKLFLVSIAQEYNFACIDYSRSDENIDAVFETYYEALDYKEYYKDHHYYDIVLVTKSKQGKDVSN